MPNVAPNIDLREKLADKDLKYLTNYLKSINRSIYDSQYHTTKRRLIRAIEILLCHTDKKNKNINFTIDKPLIIGIKIIRDKLL